MKVLQWIWYTFFSKEQQPVEVPTGKTCPLSGAVETDQTKCPGSATNTSEETTEISDDQVDTKSAAKAAEPQEAAAAGGCGPKD